MDEHEFVLNFGALLPGYEVTGFRRLHGYGVTSLWNFFLQFLRIKRLRGYQGYQGYGGYNGLQSQGYKVTGLQTVLIFFNSRMERLQGY